MSDTETPAQPKPRSRKPKQPKPPKAPKEPKLENPATPAAPEAPPSAVPESSPSASLGTPAPEASAESTSTQPPAASKSKSSKAKVLNPVVGFDESLGGYTCKVVVTEWRTFGNTVGWLVESKDIDVADTHDLDRKVALDKMKLRIKEKIEDCLKGNEKVPWASISRHLGPEAKTVWILVKVDDPKKEEPNVSA